MSEQYNEKHASELPTGDISILIYDMLRGIRRYLLVVILIVDLFTLAGYGYAKMHYHPMYRASSTFSVSDERTNYSGDSYNKAVAKQIGSIFPYLLTSQQMKELVKKDLKISHVPESIETQTLNDTNLITISVTASDPNLAYEVLQSLVNNYPVVTKYLLGDIQLNLVDSTGVPVTPINSNNVTRRTIQGFLAGLALVAAWMFLYATTRRTVRNEEDIRKILNVSCLATVPHVKTKKRASKKTNELLINNRYISSQFVEAIRTLRIRLIKILADQHYRTLLVTSSVPGEGKTTIAANLALSLAGRGLKVLLVDADLRRCSLAETMGIPSGQQGFVDVLRGERSVSEVLVPYEKEPNLSILPGGQPIDRVAELLREETLQAVMQQLESCAEILILDTPPSAVVTDASVLAKYVDGALYVVRQDYAKYDGVLDGVEVLYDSNVPIIGCILNNATAAASGYRYGGYGYGYGYGNGYGYSYGYAEKTEEEKPSDHESDEEYIEVLSKNSSDDTPAEISS